MTTLAYTVDTDESVIFASNGSCTLTPEGESGPYCKSFDICVYFTYRFG